MFDQLSHIGDGGIALGIVTGAVLIIYLLTGVFKLGLEVTRENNAARNAIDNKRAQLDEEQNNVLKDVSTQLQITRASQEAVTATLLQIAQILRDHDQHASKVVEITEKLQRDIEADAQQRNARLDKLPAILEETIKPQIDGLFLRLERQQQQLETLTKEVRVRDLPEAIRGEIAQLVLLASNISADVKVLLKSTLGESEKPSQAPEASEAKSEGTS